MSHASAIQTCGMKKPPHAAPQMPSMCSGRLRKCAPSSRQKMPTPSANGSSNSKNFHGWRATPAAPSSRTRRAWLKGSSFLMPWFFQSALGFVRGYAAARSPQAPYFSGLDMLRDGLSIRALRNVYTWKIVHKHFEPHFFGDRHDDFSQTRQRKNCV